MTAHYVIGIAAGLIGLAAFIPYIFGTLKNPDEKPHRVTWFTWAFIDWLLLKSSLDSGATSTLIVLGGYSIGGTIMALLSLSHGKGGASKTDWVCIVLILCAFVVIAFDYRPSVVLGMMLAIGWIASFPTIVQAWKYAQELPLTPWIMFWGSGAGNLFAVNDWSSWNVYAMPLCHTAIQTLILGPLLLRRRSKPVAVYYSG